LLVAIVSGVISWRANTRLAELESQRLTLSSQLEEQRSVSAARRDYEYEARKRLYTQCEPRIFEALELARNAQHRVASLARSARLRQIGPDGTGWLSAPGYYLQSTTFLLLAPVTAPKLLQRRLTQVDLRLERRLRTQYELLKLLFLTFTDDHELADYEPGLPYDPDRADPEEPRRDDLLASQPAKYARQGFYLGMLEVVAESFIAQKDSVERSMSFGEFMSASADSRSQIHKLVTDNEGVFYGFHPLRKPVLWRVLIAQWLLYDTFLKTQQWPEDDDKGFDVLERVCVPEVAPFDWRTSTDQVPAATIQEPFDVAQAYLKHKFRELAETLRS
jgi:hypothetical protein